LIRGISLDLSGVARRALVCCHEKICFLFQCGVWWVRLFNSRPVCRWTLFDTGFWGNSVVVVVSRLAAPRTLDYPLFPNEKTAQTRKENAKFIWLKRGAIDVFNTAGQDRPGTTGQKPKQSMYRKEKDFRIATSIALTIGTKVAQVISSAGFLLTQLNIRLSMSTLVEA